MHSGLLCAVLVIALILTPQFKAFSYAETTTGEIAQQREFTPVDTVREILSADSEKDNESMQGYPLRSGTKRTGNSALSVEFPVAYDFIIDPQNYFGSGQIFSDEQNIKNHSKTDIVITITEFSIIFPKSNGYAALSEPYDNNSSDTRKAIYLELSFDVPGEESVVIKGSVQDDYPSIRLSSSGRASSVCAVTITGNVNPNPAEKWQAGDVKISLSYLIETLEDYTLRTSEDEPAEDLLPEEDADEEPETPADEESDDSDESGEDIGEITDEENPEEEDNNEPEVEIITALLLELIAEIDTDEIDESDFDNIDDISLLTKLLPVWEEVLGILEDKLTELSEAQKFYLEKLFIHLQNLAETSDN